MSNFMYLSFSPTYCIFLYLSLDYISKSGNRFAIEFSDIELVLAAFFVHLLFAFDQKLELYQM